MVLSWILILVAVIVAVLAVGVAFYTLINFQHPEDANQAWLPKVVVVGGLTLAIWTVLLFPLDVANKAACGGDLSYCQATFPTAQLWYACYIANAVLVYGVIPFTMFYYEADSDAPVAKRLLAAFAYEALTAVVVGLLLGILYAVVGFVEYPVTPLQSGLAPLAVLNGATSLSVAGGGAGAAPSPSTTLALDVCIVPGSGSQPVFGGRLCDAINGGITPATWRQRCSFPVYVIALASSAGGPLPSCCLSGWLLFMVFAGAGFVLLPYGLIRAFLGRPRTTITRSEYLKRARGLGQRGKALKRPAAHRRQWGLQGGEPCAGPGGAAEAGGPGGAFRRMNEQLVALEADTAALELVFPQGEDPDYMWVLVVVGFWVRLAAGVASALLTVAWLLQTVLYLFVYPPVTPLLNSLFTVLDGVFPLFGTAAFALFCFYLIVATIEGATQVGLNLLLFTVHPMKVGATLMSSFLFNVALILLATNAAIQFCSQAFALYANDTAIGGIWGSQIMNLQGIKYLYRTNVFLYCLIAIVGLTLIGTLFCKTVKWKRLSAQDRLEAAYAA